MVGILRQEAIAIRKIWKKGTYQTCGIVEAQVDDTLGTEMMAMISRAQSGKQTVVKNLESMHSHIGTGQSVQFRIHLINEAELVTRQ